MKTINEIKEHLEQILRPGRYIHTIHVYETAVRLAKIHGCDTVQAAYAGILHDCAKCIEPEEQIEICAKYGVPLSGFELANPSLLHAKTGALLARTLYGVEDTAVCHAIACHTTGCPDMSLLDKIIYIADYIEPGRERAPRLGEIRAAADTDLDKSLLMILEDTIEHLKSKGKPMDNTTIETYNYYRSNI